MEADYLTLEMKLLLVGGIVGLSIPVLIVWTNQYSMRSRLKVTSIFVLGSIALVGIANVIADTMNA